MYTQDQPPNTFRKFFRKSDVVKMRENAPVDARFFQLFDFGLILGTLNGLLAMQNPDTPVRELSQASGEASGFKIGYFCAILRLLTRCDFLQNLPKMTHFCIF